MKYLILVNLAFGLLAKPAFAVANFSGHWFTNTGKLSSTVGLKADCTRIEITIEQKADSLLTKSYRADCGTYGPHWGPTEEIIKGGKVYEGEGEDEEEVGTINEDTLITVSHSGGVAYAYNLKLHPNPDGSATLQSYYGVKNGVGTIVIEGNLQKVKP